MVIVDFLAKPVNEDSRVRLPALFSDFVSRVFAMATHQIVIQNQEFAEIVNIILLGTSVMSAHPAL